MTLRLNGATSGYTEIDAPAVAGSNTITLPTGNGTADQRLVTDGSGALSFTSNVMLAAGSAGSPSLYFSGDANTGMWSPAADTLAWSTAGSERMRIDSSGRVGVGVVANEGVLHAKSSATNERTIAIEAGSNAYAENMSIYLANRTASTVFTYLTAYNKTTVDTEFGLRGDGNGFCDGAWTGGGADYAEYFEWSDGNPNAEDRRGISVVLDSDKIREALPGEDPIGVISGNPSIIGDAAWNKWNGKYLRDDYGTYIQENYSVQDEDGNTVIQQRRKLNPAYSANEEYTPREGRPEWDAVGLMGKLRIRKGQPTGSRWIKMRDISATVEEWLVR